MVWDVLEDLIFEDNRALRAVHVNTLIEATYELSPVYWTVAGDIAVGASNRRLMTLAAPTMDDLFLVNDKDITNSVVWKSLDDVLLKSDDLEETYTGNSFIFSTVFVRRGHQRYSADFRRVGTNNEWAAVGDVDVLSESPLSVIYNSSPGGEISVTRSGDIIRLSCLRNCTLTVVLTYADLSPSGLRVEELVPEYVTFGLRRNVGFQEATFSVVSTVGTPGVVLLDLESWDVGNNGAYPGYLQMLVLYRY